MNTIISEHGCEILAHLDISHDEALALEDRDLSSIGMTIGDIVKLRACRTGTWPHVRHVTTPLAALIANWRHEWLHALHAHRVDTRSLACMTDDELKGLGIPIGVRVKLLRSARAYAGGGDWSPWLSTFGPHLVPLLSQRRQPNLPITMVNVATYYMW